MLPSWRMGRPFLAVPRQDRQTIHFTKRQASLTSAVERGKRRSNAATDQIHGHEGGSYPPIDTKIRQAREILVSKGRAGQCKGSPQVTNYGARRDLTKIPIPHVPISVPYTTPASQFLYGTFAVRAALKARRRRLYKLYLFEGEGSQVDKSSDIEKLARTARVRIERVSSEWARVLNKMAEGRPHNGYVLEASPLPRLPIRALERVRTVSDHIRVRLDNMSEEERDVSGGSSIVPRLARTERYPFTLLLDRVLDPGNLGGIIRSAYFLGVDAIVISRSGSAPVSAVTVKASAGAAETMPLLTANAPLDFLKKSREEGWQIFAAVSPSSESGQVRKDHFVSPEDALEDGPCLLVIGGEGEGIARSIMRETSGYVGISQITRNDGLDLVESLNVSVATALMIQQFFEKRVRDDGHTKESKPENEQKKDQFF